jgi:hypothetical protein
LIPPKLVQKGGIKEIPPRALPTQELRKPPKSSTFTHGFWRGITAQITTKGSHKCPPSNPQEKGPENNPKNSSREGSENHLQEQPGKTHPNPEEPNHLYMKQRFIQCLASRLIIHPSQQDLSMKLSC